MEFSGAEIIAIAAVILNVIVYVARVPTKNDLANLRSEMNQRFAELSNELGQINERIDQRLGGHP